MQAEFAIDAPYKGVQQPLPDEAGVLSAIKATAAAMMEFIENGAGASLPPTRRQAAGADTITKAVAKGAALYVPAEL